MQQDLFIIDTLEKLKVISDPLRTKILMNLVKQEYTGQQLAEILAIPKTKIYFHLKELEKHGIVRIVREEEKNGIMQKFYKAVARRFIPSDDLLPSHELIETSRQVFLETVLTTRQEIEKAPGEAFQLKSHNQDMKKNLAATYQFHATEEQFTAFLKEFKELYHKHFKQQEANGPADAKPYMMSLIGFQRSVGGAAVFGDGQEDTDHDDNAIE